MTSAASTNRSHLRSRRAAALALALACAASMAAASGLPFSKTFAPDVIGPGSTSMLTFKLGPAFVAEFDISFIDVLPAGVTLAAPAIVKNSCGGALSAPDGGGAISFSDGMLGSGKSCEIVVNTTSSTPGVHMNVSGAVTSSGSGVGGTAADDLTVDTSLPGFSKSFSPSTVAFGGRSTLTLTIDNTLNASSVPNLDFTDILPPGMVVASPSNKATTCGTATIPAILGAKAGSSTIVLDANGTAGFPAVAAGASCTVTVDVIGGAVGRLGNVSDNLLAEFVMAGKAAAVLEVTGVAELLELRKRFVDDPVAPGGTTTLEFTVVNKSRDDAATGITFDDDLEATLSGLTAALPGTPDPPCGAGSSLSLSMAGVLTLSGGSLPAEGSCTFSVVLTVPAGAAPGTYPNTAGPVSGTVGGEPETGNAAGDLLFVVDFPLLTKEFTDDPVAAGDSVTLEFSITNTSTSALTDITFVDELTDNGSSGAAGAVGNGFLPFPVSVGLPPSPDPPCGPGSSLALILVDSDRQGLELTGGSLDASDGMPGGSDTCTFSLTVDIPAGFPGGTYLNTTEEISATRGTTTVIGNPASDEIVIAGAPNLSKEFTDDPVLPSGGPVTLELNLVYEADEGSPDATAIAFTDDLKTVLPGTPDLSAASLDSNTCAGSTVDIVTDPTVIDFSGGTLSAGESCTVVLTITVPAGAPIGLHTNATSDVSSVTGGVAVSGPGGSDDLLVTPLTFSKEFVGDPLIPGQPVSLVFTITNLGASPAEDATSIFFSDDLAAILGGPLDVTNTGPPSTNTCGGADLGLPTFIFYSGGSLAGGATCTVVYDLATPAAADDGDYVNVSSPLSAFIGGSPVSVPAASDVLSLDSELLALSKEFTDDPVAPGGTATLALTLENLSPDETVTDITFTDNLGAALAGLVADSVLSNSCGGASTLLPSSTVTFSSISLAPLASCTIEIAVDVPAAPLAGSPPFINTTSAVGGKVGVLDVFGAEASDELLIQLLTLTKEFTDDPVFPGDSVTLNFTITNLDSAPIADLSFSDNLAATLAGLTATTLPAAGICGAGSALTGSTFLAFTGGSLAGGGSCVIPVTLTVPAGAPGGDFLNSTSGLFRAGLLVASAATDFLKVEKPPTFTKAFVPATVGESFESTLTFTIDNSGSTLAATALDFFDMLPFPLAVSAVPGAVNTCGGTLVADPFSTTISFTGGAVGAGASCSISVQIGGAPVGSYENTSGDLTSSSGNSGKAVATLTVVGCTAMDGANATLTNQVVFGSETVEVCNTIEVKQHFKVVGGGVLVLRAGVAVIIFNGVEFDTSSTVTVEIDPGLIP